MDGKRVKYDVVVVGGGPGGLAAAYTAAQHGCSVAIIESSAWLGGQIWRHGATRHAPLSGKRWLRAIHKSPVDVRLQTTVVGSPEPNTLLAETPENPLTIEYARLILAVGARELFIPFPGWTLPNVFGIGGLHNLAKLGWSVRGKRIAVAGSGPLMFAVAAHLRMQGAKILLMAEQTDFSELVKFGMKLPVLAPSKILQAGIYQTMLLGVPYKTHCWPVKAFGKDQLDAVKFTNQNKTWTVSCDYLACAFGLAANLELPYLLGCRIDGEVVVTDSFQKSSVENIYCVGEITGIAGVDGSLTEGIIAGHSVAGHDQEAEKYITKKRKTQEFGQALGRSFTLRQELRNLATSDTILCRCEDATVGQVRNEPSWLAAKLYHHVGMGPCQGRTCGGAVRFLFGWQPSSVRPPVYPVKTGTLALCSES